VIIMSKKAIRALLALLLAVGLLPVLGVGGAAAQTIRVKVTAEQANLRERPDIGSAIVQQIPEGTVLEADKKEGEWYLVRYTLEDGGVIAGYIHESLVTVVGQPPPPVPPPARTAPPESRPAPAASARESVFPLDIYVSIGGGPVIADDLNNAARGLAGYNGALLGMTSGGSIPNLRLTYLLGFEFSYRLYPWLGLSLGYDYLKAWRSGTVTYSAEGEPPPATPLTSTHVSVQSGPVKLGVRFYPGRDFYFRGNLGYYTGRAGYNDRLVYPDGAEEKWSGKATAHTLGMELAVGGEWAVGPKLSAIAEAGYRLARLNDFTGTGTFTDAAGVATSESGGLWYFSKTAADSADYDLLFIRAARPAEEGVTGARKAEVNLSGTIFRVGLRIRF
jgi:hypothetical protein